MKVAMEKMTDIKVVLNRFFANEDLFDEKMDLKHQQVSKPQKTNYHSKLNLDSQVDKTETQPNSNLSTTPAKNNWQMMMISGRETSLLKPETFDNKAVYRIYYNLRNLD